MSMVRGCAIFLGLLFHDRLRIYGYGFQQFSAFSEFMEKVFSNFQHFPDLWVWVFCKNSFIGEHFQNFRIYGYDFQKIFRINGHTFQNFGRISGWYFYDLNGTTLYLGNSSDSPPPGTSPQGSTQSATQSISRL